MSSDKDKIGISQEPVEKDDKLTHQSDERDFVRFSVLAVALVNGAEDRIVLAGGQGSHVEDAANCGPAAGNVALASILAAVMVDGARNLWRPMHALALPLSEPRFHQCLVGQTAPP